MKIEAKPGKADKMHIHIDDAYAFTVDAAFWYRCGWAYESEIDAQALAQLESQVMARRAYNKALSLLDRRDHCRRELEKKLERDFDPDAVEAALNRAEEQGLLDDAGYAERLAEELLRRKSLSPYAIRAELCRRGVDRHIAETVCDALDVDEREAVETLLATRFAGQWDTPQGRRRVFAALQRMGYARGDILRAMELYEE